MGGHDSAGLASGAGQSLLSWQSLVFLLPFGAAVFLLLLSSLRLGGGGHRHTGAGFKGHAGGGHGRHHSGGGHAKTAGSHAKSSAKHGAKPSGNASKAHVTPLGILFALVGVNRAPLPLLIQVFCLSWGVGGLAASRVFMGSAAAQTAGVGGRFLLCLLIALASGFFGARIGAELLARFMPQESTSVVSRDALYGLTGKVLFPVTESGGRVRVYDEWNTLHDEPCRKAQALSNQSDVEPSDAPIAKGRTVRIIDRDAKGCLLVEEV